MQTHNHKSIWKYTQRKRKKKWNKNWSVDSIGKRNSFTTIMYSMSVNMPLCIVLSAIHSQSLNMARKMSMETWRRKWKKKFVSFKYKIACLFDMNRYFIGVLTYVLLSISSFLYVYFIFGWHYNTMFVLFIYSIIYCMYICILYVAHITMMCFFFFSEMHINRNMSKYRDRWL